MSFKEDCSASVTSQIFEAVIKLLQSKLFQVGGKIGMVIGPWGSIATFVYSGIWDFCTVLTKKQLTAVNLLSV